MFKRVYNVLREFVNFVRGVNQAIIEESVGALELEYVELEAAFLTLVMGSLTGVKTIPTLLSLELLEPLKDELKVLTSRAVKGKDVLGDLMSSLGGEW